LLMLPQITFADVPCNGNACSDVKHRFTDRQSNTNFSYEVTNTGSNDLNVRVVWGGILGTCGVSNRGVLYPGEAVKFQTPNNQTIGVCRIDANIR